MISGSPSASISALPPRDFADGSRFPEPTRPEAICPELDCLRGLLATEMLREASRRARQIGVTADRVLVGWQVIDDDAYVRRLAGYLGLGFEDFRKFGRDDCLLSDDQFRFALQSGLLPLRKKSRIIWIIAPRNNAARNLTERLAALTGTGDEIRLTTTERFNEFADRAARDPLTSNAIDGLKQRHPDLSAGPGSVQPRSISTKFRSAIGPLAILCGLLLAPLWQLIWPNLLLTCLSVLLSLAFLSFATLRLTGCLARPKTNHVTHRIPDHELPVYSVVAGLYKEAKSVGKLIGFLRAMDYPPEKLQIILALEPDDLATRAAVARLGPTPNLQIVLAPNAGPRTKPKALNYALPFVRGSVVAVYDAEDEPEPDQLRNALQAFQTHGPDVACVQASLCINNGDDGWLARTFTAEYAGQFDVFLQGASRLKLPLPLGGSSNHFRTDVLRASGAWDAYNVTEDADLGLRLARLGWHSVMFPSTTREEAPAFLMPWLRQRTRWMKGWMQTWAVHMRAPRQLYRDIGWRGFVSINLLVGGNVVGALAYPCLLGVLAFNTAQYAAGNRTTLLQHWPDDLHLAAAMSGLVVAFATGLAGLRRRRLLRHAWVLALTPLYWLALSAAAWRALWQFVFNRYHWEKTEHGLARSHHGARSVVTQASQSSLKPELASAFGHPRR